MDLRLPMNGFYFDQVLSGDKIEEYRLVNDYWRKRLKDRSYRNVVLTRGYPKAGGVEGVTRITRPWRGYVERVITHPLFGSDPVSVFALDVRP